MKEQTSLQQLTLDDAEILKKLLAKGDLSSLTTEQQVRYYVELCHRHRLDPLSKPFDFLEMTDRQGRRKVVLYGNKECAAQLRTDRRVSIYKIEEVEENGFYKVTAYARMPDGREDLDKGVVLTEGLEGDYYASAVKKAITQAKRRVTLSICGLGMLDETEVDAIPDARRMADPAGDDGPIHQRQSSPLDPRQASPLDAWRCGKTLAVRILNLSGGLKIRGVTDETIKSWLPEGIASRKDLNARQAVEFIENLSLRHRLVGICDDLVSRGVDRETIRQRLPGGASGLNDLGLDQVEEAIEIFNQWLSMMGAATDVEE